MDITTKITNELYKIFDALNEEYFENSLPKPFITIKQGKSKNKAVYGTFSPKSWVHKDGEKIDEVTGIKEDIIGDTVYHEISMSGEYLSRPFANMCATLCHEMVHFYCEINDIKDTSNNAVYHNNKFKAEAEKRGLIIEKAPTIGWSVTTPAQNLITFVNNLDVDKEVFNYFRRTQIGITNKITVKKRWKCPICGQEVSGKKDAEIGCWICNKQMDFWDLTIEGNETILVDNNNGLAMSEDGWYGAES